MSVSGRCINDPKIILGACVAASGAGNTTDTGKGGGAFAYKVCEVANPDNCTNTVTVSP